jgi:chromatin remodeling complex protein RSC6
LATERPWPKNGNNNNNNNNKKKKKKKKKEEEEEADEEKEEEEEEEKEKEEEEEEKEKKKKKKVQLTCKIKFICCYHKLTAFPADITVKPNHTGRYVSHGQKFNNLPSYSEGPGLKSWLGYWHILWYL